LGEVLTPITKLPIYHIKGNLDSKIYNSLSNLINQVKEQENELKGNKFIDLLSPKPDRKSGSAAVDSRVNIISFLEKLKDKPIEVDLYWKKDLNNSADKLEFDVRKSIDTDEYIEVTPMISLSDMLYQCYATRSGLINLAKYYDDKEKMEQASNIWAMMKKIK